jgi:hypothetical protein
MHAQHEASGKHVFDRSKRDATAVQLLQVSFD